MKRQKILSLTMALFLAIAIVLLLSPAVLAAEYDSSGATTFTFSDSGIAMAEGSYSGYEVDGTALTINAAGTYVVSGSCADGSITVKKGTTGVTLVLNGLTLTSSDTAPISCNKSSGVTIVAASGTTNTLTDSAYNNDDNYPDNGNAENAVIKCKDGSQVIICGAGTINIVANGKNGIKSGATTDEEGEAWLQIQDVTLNITASVNDGINAEQLLTIASGTITVNAADDGIHSDYILNVGAEGTTGPTISIGSSYEGLEAATLNIDSGNLTIQSTDDCLNAANSDLSDYSFSLNIAGGTVYMYSSTGDGIDSNGTITISGGTTQVWTANAADNQALDADGVISITGGVVLAAGGSAGQGMNLSAGQPYVIFGSSTMGGQFGGQSSVSVSSGSTFTIMDSSGNTVYSGTAGCNASYVVFSSASLASGETYTLYSGGTGIASASAQLVADGNGNTDGQPSAPGNGEQPSAPGNEEQPSAPENGEQPSAPENGEQPSAPGNGEQPSAPGSGEQPSVPGSGEQPGAPTEQPSAPTEQPNPSQEQTETQKKKTEDGTASSGSTELSSTDDTDETTIDTVESETEEVTSSSSPDTGDDNLITLWVIVLAIFGSVGLAITHK